MTERGSASIVVVALAGVLLLIGLAASHVTATAVAHRRAQAAADLAALAGAGAHQRGEDPCPVAADVAARNHARLASCVDHGKDVVVEVTVEGPELLGLAATPTGRARAGPG